MINKTEVNEVGRHFGKRDLDRVGYFDDTVGGFGEYKSVTNFYRNKGKQFIAGQPNDYFDKKYKRLFEGEYLYQQQNDKTKKKSDGRWIVPTSPTKLHSTPDDWFGCFGKPISYFSPAIKDDRNDKNKKQLPNFKTKPSPLGGPGYVDITLNPYPKYIPEPYIDQSKIQKKEKKGKFLTSIRGPDYFSLNPYVQVQPGPTYVDPSNKKFTTIGAKRLYVPFPKKPGGMHDGCFNKFPEYFNGTDEKKKQDKHDFVGKFIVGGLNSKSKYTFSIIDRVTKVSCNANNFLGYQPRVYPVLK